VTGYTWRGRSPRQQLEATIWRWWPDRSPHAPAAVDAILAAADTYVRETVAGVTRLPPPDDPAVTRQRRELLGDAVHTRPR